MDFVAVILAAREDVAESRATVVALNQSENPGPEFNGKFDNLILAIEDGALRGDPQTANRLIEVVPAATAVAKFRRETLEAFEGDLTAETPRFRGEFWARLDALFSAIDKAKHEPRPPQFDSVLMMAKQGLPLNQICICWPTLSRAEIQNLIHSSDPTKDTDPASHPDVVAWHKQQATRPRLALAPLIGEVAQIRFDRQRQCAETT